MSITNFCIFFMDPGRQIIALSMFSAYKWVISMATRSPCWAEFTGFLKISIDFIFDFCWISQISISSPAFTLPSITVPVRIVPFPLILKQWSANMVNFLSSITLFGISNSFNRVALRSLQYLSIFYFAEQSTMVTFSPNLVLLNTFLKATIFAGMTFSSRQSTLLSTTMSLWTNISATIMHSAVCVCMPLLMSMTKNIRSMIWAPPIMVRIREAWPGQSTRVNWKYFYLTLVSSSSETLVMKEENPRSSVMPRSLDCGLLSRLAVDAT